MKTTKKAPKKKVDNTLYVVGREMGDGSVALIDAEMCTKKDLEHDLDENEVDFQTGDIVFKLVPVYTIVRTANTLAPIKK